MKVQKISIYGDNLEVQKQSFLQTSNHGNKRKKREKINCKNILDSKIRCRRRMIHLASENFSAGDLFVTLTYHYSENNYNSVRRDVKIFFQKLKYHNKDVKYLGCIELHPERSGDVFHIHFLINNCFNYNELFLFWNDSDSFNLELYRRSDNHLCSNEFCNFRNSMKRGFIFVEKINDNVDNIGAYIGQYLKKDKDIDFYNLMLLGKKMTFRSRNLIQPLILSWKNQFVHNYEQNQIEFEECFKYDLKYEFEKRRYAVSISNSSKTIDEYIFNCKRYNISNTQLKNIAIDLKFQNLSEKDRNYNVKYKSINKPISYYFSKGIKQEIINKV